MLPGKSARTKHCVVSLAVVLAVLLLSQACWADAMERMQLSRLKAVHNAVELLKEDRQPVTLVSPYGDYRSLLHVHSHLSHDSNGSIEEIVKQYLKLGSVGVRKIPGIFEIPGI